MFEKKDMSMFPRNKITVIPLSQRRFHVRHIFLLRTTGNRCSSKSGVCFIAKYTNLHCCENIVSGGSMYQSFLAWQFGPRSRGDLLLFLLSRQIKVSQKLIHFQHVWNYSKKKSKWFQDWDDELILSEDGAEPLVESPNPHLTQQSEETTQQTSIHHENPPRQNKSMRERCLFCDETTSPLKFLKFMMPWNSWETLFVWRALFGLWPCSSNWPSCTCWDSLESKILEIGGLGGQSGSNRITRSSEVNKYERK